MIVFGVVCAFFGGKFFPYVLATVAGGATFLVLLVILSVFGALKALETNSSRSAGQIAVCILSFVAAAAVAIFVGWFVKKARRIGGAILGAVAGFVLGFILYNLVFAQWWNNIACLIIVSFGLCFAGGFAAWKWDKLIIVYLTAFIGGYALVRGVAVFAGNFPNEITTFQEIIAGTFVLNNYFYYYLGSFAVVTFVGIITQFKLGYHEHHHDSDGYNKIN